VRSFKLPPAVDRQLDVRARAEGLTASDVLRELVDKYLRGET
jgi:predicted DNA-binding protein